MPVNEAVSTYSDMAFATSVATYLAAMVLYFGEFAYGRSRNAVRSRPREMATAGAQSSSVASSASPDAVGRIEAAERRPWPERVGGMAVAMTVLGALVHAFSLVTRGVAIGRAPWGNMYEFGSASCLVAVLAWLVALYRQSRPVRKDTTSPQLRSLGGFLLLPTTILLFLSGTVFYTEAAPLQPSLQSYWIWIHVSAAIISTGGLVLAGIASILFLLRTRHQNNPLTLAKFGPRLPSSQTLDRMAYRVTVLIMPVWTFALMAGAIWAEAAWGRFWGWDPKETCGFIAWVVYACYLHARATAGWRGVRAAWINILGLAAMLFNLFFVNIVITGLHSYAGI